MAEVAENPQKNGAATMLIQVSVENFRSIRDRQTLSMVASKALKRRPENTISPDTAEKSMPHLLRCAAVFGPNASGKTTLLKAVKFMEQMVMYSADAKVDEPVDVEPYLLDPEFAERDSHFEVEFIEKGVRYQLGFSVNRERVTEEWLISYPKSRAQVLYRRSCGEPGAQDEYQFGSQLEGGRLRKDWASLTGPKTLYISRVVQASSSEFQQLRSPYEWFSRRLRVLLTRTFSSDTTSKMCRQESGKRKVVEFMEGFGLPIADIEVKEVPFDFEALSKVVRQEAITEMFGSNKPGPSYEPIFLHARSDGEMVRFKKSDESSGTLNLFGFASRWIDVVEGDWVLFVDELDSSLHPLVVWELIRKLLETNSKAQLIFTTHDASVLRSKLLRRDQVYFVSQDSAPSTKLYSLHDFKGREDDAVEDRYLQGRYGATPIIAR
jgi:uncharacterized protein